MTFLEQEISFDMGHAILLLALVGFIYYIVTRCKINGKEGMHGHPLGGVNVEPVHPKVCHCPDCAKVALEQAQSGQLYGCNPNNPYVPYSPEECNLQYRKTLLHGCGVI